MNIDPAIEQQLHQEPGKAVDVILVCPDCSDALQTILEQAGCEITNRDHAEHGMIYGRITDLTSLRDVEGIESITLDSTEYAL